MKQVKFTMPLRMLAIVCGIFLSVSVYGQSITVNGHVKDATGEPVTGATISVGGKAAAVSDIDGNFTINTEQGKTLSVSYIGYLTATVTASPNVVVTLEDDAQTLEQVVVIGYGSVKKSDLTGSVVALKPDSKNKGLVVNAQDMIVGKIAGVNVTPGDGTPGGGATIRVRAGSSLNGSNNPLIVIDGVPMDDNGVKGLANPLSMVNPQDIESFNVLKDASATAIYGSRGSNGVIIITTKKGHKGQKLNISYNGSVTASMKKKTIDVMNGDEFREFVTNLYRGTDREQAALAALGTANTDWQDEIYRTAISTDHAITLSGSVGLGDKNYLPWRASVGYTDQNGIVKTSNFQRYTGAVNLSPSFFDDHLNINLNLKGMWAKSRYADGTAISAAVWFDPTQSPYDTTSSDAANFGNYFEWKTSGSALNDPTWPNTYNNLAQKNPLAVLKLKNDHAISRDFIGNADIDYKVHGFEDLRLHATFGADISQGTQQTNVDPASPLAIYYGSYGWDRILKRNLLMNYYAQYYHDFNDAAKNHIDVMAGYEWQHFWRKQHNQYWGYYPETNADTSLRGQERNHTYYDFATEHYLISFFGRANWTLMDSRYMLTATFRADGSSRFKDHWGYFPSFAFAWRIKDENKFRDIKWLSDLKLRLGYGITGQQEFESDYAYIANYEMNTGTDSYYPVTGDGTLARPKATSPDLTWEKTTTYNFGVDFGLWDQRLTGSVDWYFRKTDDLLNYVYVPAGANFRNQAWSNIGTMTNTGVEVQLDWRAIYTKDWRWILGYNFTYNHNEITKLTGGDDDDYYVATGGISSGTGNTAQAHKVGYAASSFYVYQQVYDENGLPIEGAVVDRNGDGQITEADKYIYKSPNAPVTMGFSSRLEWKNWDFGFSLRASIGNYIFNDVLDGAANINQSEIFAPTSYLSNRPIASLKANWQTYDPTSTLSDRWVQNASFLKCDNITLGYSFASLFKCGSWNGLSGRVYGTASNVFTITNYDGIDPEVYGGIDNNIYPRPISFILGLSLNF